MADTTISVSKKFHDWLKGKGRKGESYEDIIKKVLKAEFSKELERVQESSSAQPSKERASSKAAIKEIKKISEGIFTKAKASTAPKTKKKVITSKKIVKPAKNKASGELKQWRYEKNLELQRLETELELAKLSNDSARAKELSSSIAELKYQLEQRK